MAREFLIAILIALIFIGSVALQQHAMLLEGHATNDDQIGMPGLLEQTSVLTEFICLIYLIERMHLKAYFDQVD